MSANTKIVVLRSKELIYTTVLIVIGLVILLIVMSFFKGNEVPGALSSPDENTNSQTSYVPGVYTSTFTLGNSNLQLQVTVDNNHINDISLVNLDEAITTMYPLVQPALNDIASKIIETQSIQNISYPDETKYTSMILIKALEEAINKSINN